MHEKLNSTNCFKKKKNREKFQKCGYFTALDLIRSAIFNNNKHFLKKSGIFIIVVAEFYVKIRIGITSKECHF